MTGRHGAAHLAAVPLPVNTSSRQITSLRDQTRPVDPGPAAAPQKEVIPLPVSWNRHLRAFDTYLRAAGRPQSTRYMRNYQLRRFVSDHRDIPLKSITEDHLVDWIGNQTWSPETRRSYRASLRTFFAWTHATGRTRTNPAVALPPIRPARAVPRPTPDQILTAALQTAEPRTRRAILLVAATGLRRAEAAAVHRDDVEGSPGAYHLRVVGKGGHVRLVPVSDAIARMIDAADGYVFPGRINGHISPAYLGKLVSRALGHGWTTHTLRHRFATKAFAVDYNLRAVQELLGHASVATTQIYTAVPDDARRRAAAAAEFDQWSHLAA